MGSKWDPNELVEPVGGFRDQWDLDDLDNHHPPCPGGCGELADECMCNWPPTAYIDGRDPAEIEHLCITDLTIHDGPVEKCCIDQWRDQGANP